MGRIFTITEGLENMGALKTGGQGSVYKGKRKGEIVTAVKLLPTPIHAEHEDDKNYRDFQNEVNKLKKVNENANPNVVKILSSGITESGGLPFIEMEFIEGPDLEELLKPPHDPLFTVSEVVKVANHLSNALAHCHRVSVKHGDIKSNNVKLNVHTGNYMLLDFGLAVMSDEQRRTSLRHAGAIEFMAPEQNQGELYFQTDVYSFGVILFELLAGVVPFPLADNGETSRNNVMLSHMEAPVPDLLELRKQNLPESWTAEKRQLELSVPEWLLKVVYKCLEKKPDDRFRDGVELNETILQYAVLSFNQNHAGEELTRLQKENEHLRTLLISNRKGTTNRGNSDEVSGFKGLKRSFLNLGPFTQGLIGAVVLILLASGLVGLTRLRTDDNLATEKALLTAENRKLRDSITLLNALRVDDSIKTAIAIDLARKEEARKIAALYAEAQESDDKGKGREKERGKAKEKLKKWFQVRF